MSYIPKRGDKVSVNPEECYISYSQFIKWHPQYAIRWAYKVRPKLQETYTVLGTYRHVMRATKTFPDTNKYCVVVQNKIKQIFLVGEQGVFPVVPKQDEV